jgi:hypothetical protein
MTMPRSFTVALAALALFAVTVPGQAEQAASACIYASRSYGDGAVLCVQKSIALICRSDTGRFAWTTVADKDLADRCTAPEPHMRPHHVRVRTAYRVRHHDPMIDAAKCFVFNGKRYCE